MTCRVKVKKDGQWFKGYTSMRNVSCRVKVHWTYNGSQGNFYWTDNGIYCMVLYLTDQVSCIVYIDCNC